MSTPAYLKQWRAAAKLRNGEHLKTANGTTAVADGGTVPADHDGWMWDLTVPGNDDHDFYVLSAQDRIGSARYSADTFVLVHNCPSGDSINPRDVHGELRSAERTAGDEVWNNPESEMYIQNDGQVVKVLQTGNNNYSVAVRDMSNPSGSYTTVMKNYTEQEIEKNIETGRWS
jgi:hypothetical protein